jgi:putative DNA primase/helicase
MLTPPQSSIQNSPPKPLRVSAEAIPHKLKRRPQFVNWRYAWDGKKWTKHPYNPRTGEKASSTDLMTWSTFSEVLDAYETGDYDGVGFVFCSADPFVGIDLDECHDPESGEISPWALQIIDAVKEGYIEVSPSGTGVHIIIEGKVRAGGMRQGPIELYSRDRFFTLTGRPV